MVSPKINLLSEHTIDKIAAGEVIERPASVAKELVENAIDAGASRIVVEIKGGGIAMLRVTDNGCGILKSELNNAFLRHSTSKIKDEKDLLALHTLGFRGEALSSIVAVAHVECMTKTKDSIIGYRFVPKVDKEGEVSEIGAPDGTTFVIRDLFYNTPARLKFLKSPKTESSYIQELIEKIALSKPDISFQFISDGKVKLSTPGNGNLKDCVYEIYGKDFVKESIYIEDENEYFKIHGYLGKPYLNRASRSYECVFTNGRFVKSKILSKAIEDGYHGFLMGHQFPFCVLFFDVPTDKLDVNVHPNKTEIRLSDETTIARLVEEVISISLKNRDYAIEETIGNEVKLESITNSLKEPNLINEDISIKPQEDLEDKTETIIEEKIEEIKTHTEPFETSRIEKIVDSIKKDSPYEKKYEQRKLDFDGLFAKQEYKAKYELIGQVFNTYWIIQFEDRMYLMDQHAAHEKVLYERTMRSLKDKTMSSQLLSPPVIISLSPEEQSCMEDYREYLTQFGYDFEHFGGREVAITAVPANLFNINVQDAIVGFLGQLMDSRSHMLPEIILDKIASMSCKAAIKGGTNYSFAEAKELMEELFTLEDPYHCPHGRPTLITMTQSELEKKFKRIVG